MLVHHSLTNPHHRPTNPVTQEVARRAGYTRQKEIDRVDWIVEKYDVQKPEDYPAAVHRHNKKGLALMGSFVAGMSAFMLGGVSYMIGVGAPVTKYVALAGAATMGLTGAMLERGYEHKSFDRLPGF